MGTNEEALTINVTPPNNQQLTTMAARMLSLAESYKITSPEIYTLAADDLAAVKKRITELDEQRKGITRPLDEAKDKVMSLFRSPIETLKKAEQIIKNAMLAFDDEQERMRRIREEQMRQQQEAEQRQRDAEAAAARAAAEEAERLLQKATTPEQIEEATARVVETTVAVEQAQEKVAEIEHAPAPIAVSATPKVSGVSKSSTWKGECFDKMALIKAVAEGNAAVTLLDVNETVLNQMARALKETMNIPGCKVVEVKGLSSRRK